MGYPAGRPRADAEPPERAPALWWAPLPLVAAGTAWWLLGGDGARFLDLVGPSVAPGGLALPALPALPFTGPRVLEGMGPSVLQAGVLPLPGARALLWGAPAAAVSGAVLLARWWRDRHRLVRGQRVKRFLRGADREIGPPVLEGVLHRAALTLVYSPPGVGKSEWSFALIAASIRARRDGGTRFIGQRVWPAKWYVLSEQNKRSLLPYLQRWGLTMEDAEPWVVWENWQSVRGRWHRQGGEGNPPWDTVGPQVFADAKRQGCTALLLDTYMQWVADTSGALNDTGGVRKAFEPMQTACADDKLAVLVLMHTNKGGGFAGNMALMAACDAMIRLHQPDKRMPTVRELAFDKSRLDESPKAVQMILAEYGYAPYVPEPGGERPAGEEASGGGLGASPGLAVRTDGRTLNDPVLQVLRDAGPDGLSTPEIMEQTGLDRQTANRKLAKLAEARLVEKTDQKRVNSAVWRCPDGPAGPALVGPDAAG